MAGPGKEALPLPDGDAVDAILRQAAQEIVWPQFRNLQKHHVRTKSSPNDFVTVADEQCEEFLSEALTRLLPGSAVIGEEAAAADTSVLSLLDQTGDVWIIDPIDGTYNYAHEDPRFGTIVALVRDRRVVAGYIHMVADGETYAAQLGQGAYRAGNELRIAEARPFGEMTATLYVGKSRTPELFQRLKDLKSELGPRLFDRCAAAEYVSLLTGRSHYAVFTRLLPWDHAAGVLLVTEAGGCYGYFDEEPRSGPWHPVSRDVPFLLAPDVRTWRSIRDKLTE